MKEKYFVDTDVCIDLLSKRKPFYPDAAKLFTLADSGVLTLYVSSLSFPNIDYVLKSQYDFRDTRGILSLFKALVKVISVDDKIISLALASDFTDFEDAIQNFTAVENNIPILITRNPSDYKKALVKITNPESVLKSFL